MLHELIQTAGGKSKVMMTDEYAVVNQKLKSLRQSRRGDRVTFSVRPAETKEKYLHKHRYRSH